MKNLLLIISTISLLIITGCQQSGSKKDNAEAVQPKTEVATEAVLKTADLKAPEGMKFISHEKIELIADITNQGGGPAYLSVYSDYEFTSANTTKEEDYKQWNPNQNSRILASSIESNSEEYLIAVPQHINRLLVQVWFYDGRPAVSQEINLEERMSVSF